MAQNHLLIKLILLSLFIGSDVQAASSSSGSDSDPESDSGVSSSSSSAPSRVRRRTSEDQRPVKFARDGEGERFVPTVEIPRLRFSPRAESPAQFPEPSLPASQGERSPSPQIHYTRAERVLNRIFGEPKGAMKRRIAAFKEEEDAERRAVAQAEFRARMREAAKLPTPPTPELKVRSGTGTPLLTPSSSGEGF